MTTASGTCKHRLPPAMVIVRSPVCNLGKMVQVLDAMNIKICDSSRPFFEAASVLAL